uniref:Ig-like domain-containing protein n=1 Tax=Nothobranchius furzeri TaxID=105023 RepID=A0A8C6MD01_NOTFU
MVRCIFLCHFICSPISDQLLYTVEAEAGQDCVTLPFNLENPRDGEVVEWRHVRTDRLLYKIENCQEQLEDQHPWYKDRVKGDKNALETGDFSLTLMKPFFLNQKYMTYICYLQSPLHKSQLLCDQVKLDLACPKSGRLAVPPESEMGFSPRVISNLKFLLCKENKPDYGTNLFRFKFIYKAPSHDKSPIQSNPILFIESSRGTSHGKHSNTGQLIKPICKKLLI